MAAQNTMIPVAGQAPAAATDAVRVLAAPTDGSRWVLDGVLWSYTAAPSGGMLTIAWDAHTITLHVPGAGPDSVTFPSPLIFPPNTAVTITLESGGGTVVGTVYPFAYTQF